MSNNAQNNSEHQGLMEHLAELRTRLIVVLISVFVGAGIAFYFSEGLFGFVRAPIAPFLPQGGLVFTGVMDKFMAHMKLAALMGFIGSSPVWLYQIWKFVAPGLYRNEKRYIFAFLTSGTTLFLAGVAFVYLVVYPMAFQWLFEFGGAVDKPMITIDEYLSFVAVTTLVFGLAFELPLILVFLGMIGLIDQAFLRKYRRYAIVSLAILSAIITPPDVLSQSLLLIPLWLLYEISILLVGWVQRPTQTSV